MRPDYNIKSKSEKITMQNPPTNQNAVVKG
jgi:hypothetical protein